MLKVFFLFFISLLTGLTMPSMIQKSNADSLKTIQDALPDQILGWAVESQDKFFDDETIFDYINGAGEVYRAYNMLQCLSRRYANQNGTLIVLDVFHMRSSEDAFGVFTHDQDGELLEIGQGSLYRPGWLSFWKDRFFVSIYSEEGTDATKKTITELAKMVASSITSYGSKPRILLMLPSEGLQPRSVRYLHSHIVLNYHFYLSNANILNLDPQTDAVLAEYKRDKEFARLLLVLYPNEIESSKASANFVQHYLPEAKAVVLLENGKWSATLTKGNLLAAVFDAHSRGLAEDLLKGIIDTGP